MNQKQLIGKILATTLEIKEKFPELYSLLKETPLSNSSIEAEMNLNDFEQYLNTIQAQLEEKKQEASGITC